MAHPSTPQRSRDAKSPSNTTSWRSNTHKSFSTKRLQPETKSLVQDEFSCRTYETDSLVGHLTMEDVRLGSLEEVDVSRIIMTKSSDLERLHYEPLVRCLDASFNLAKSSRAEDMPVSIFENLSFNVYDQDITSLTGDHSRKPDIVGTLSRLIAKLINGRQLHWRDVMIPVESKGTWADMVRQALTYVMERLSTGSRFCWIPLLLYNHTSQQLRFAIVTRSFLVSTCAHRLTEEAGARFTVRIMRCILSWLSPAQAGYDTTWDDDNVMLPGGVKGYILKSLCRRGGILGRGTEVARVTLTGPKTEPDAAAVTSPGSDSADAPEPSTASHMVSHLDRLTLTPEALDRPVRVSKPVNRATPKPLSLIPTAKRVPVPPTPFASLKNLHQSIPTISLPNVMVVKRSWVNVDQSSIQREIFTGLKDVYGIAAMEQTYEAVSENGPDYFATKNLLPDDAKFWNVFGTQGLNSQLEPEHRRLVYVIYSSDGYNLDQAKDLKQLIRATMDACIGLYILHVNNRLHRDISFSNIIILHSPNPNLKIPEDDRFAWLATLNLSACTAVIIDGDSGFSYEPDALPSNSLRSRSGTLPCIAVELVQAWNAHRTPVFQPLQDSESAMWSMLWTALLGTDQAALTDYEEAALKALMSNQESQVSIAKYAMIYTFSQPKKWSPVLQVVLPTVSLWNTIVHEQTDVDATVWSEMRDAQASYERQIVEALVKLNISMDDKPGYPLQSQL